jgi:hypothetical protein
LKIEMALLVAFEEGADGILAAAPVKPQENVVMAVEDWHAPLRCHRGGLFLKGGSAVREYDRMQQFGRNGASLCAPRQNLAD